MCYTEFVFEICGLDKEEDIVVFNLVVGVLELVNISYLEMIV